MPLRPHLLLLATLAITMTSGCALRPAAPGQGAPPNSQAAAEIFRFSLPEGQIENLFLRQGPHAAHLVVRGGQAPRILAAFPAGNSGAGLWFESAERPLTWALGPLQPATEVLADGGALLGVEGVLSTQTQAPLLLRAAVLGSIRVLRDFNQLGVVPAQLEIEPELRDGGVRWRRRRLDETGGFSLSLSLEEGRVERREGGVIALLPEAGRLSFRLRALTAEAPLTPIPLAELLKPEAAQDPKLRQALAFLAYDEKLLAGSWQYLTYFGRDTLLSIALLLPALQPRPIEAGLASVLERINAAGEVAHEEDIGEFAILRRQAEAAPENTSPEAVDVAVGNGETPRDAPLFDYKMIDDDYMLAPVAAAYLLDTPEGRSRAEGFLARRAENGETYAAVLARNAAFVLHATRAFVQRPITQNLIGLKSGVPVGEWRDSNEGLGGGRYPYSVNAALAPAALAAIARLRRAGLLPGDAAQAAAAASVWARAAPPLFAHSVPFAAAAQAVSDYAAGLGVPAAPALASLERPPGVQLAVGSASAPGSTEKGGGALHFPALSLDAAGLPVPVLHSDYGFAMVFGEPAPRPLAAMVEAALRPFPAGLLTEAGLLVANPAYADPARVWPMFAPNRYHGAVVWSWQQALFAAGLARQRARVDLPEELQRQLATAEVTLWRVIEATNAAKTSELWSWSHGSDGYRIEPFGQRAGDVTESNAAQLWSTVYLGLRPPAASTTRPESVSPN